MSTTLTQGHSHDLGHGLLVERTLLPDGRRMIGPFIFFDYAGPVRMDATAAHQADSRPHPHIVLSTVSYLLSRAIRHRDNLSFEQVIHPGDVNWMTAGRGIVHSERFDMPDAFAGDGLELLQSWLALPVAQEETAPRFANHPHLTASLKGFEIYAVVDAVDGTSLAAHEAALRRIEQAGAKLISKTQLYCELQRDWARAKTVPGFMDVFENWGRSNPENDFER